jgi:hypothetical protein
VEAERRRLAEPVCYRRYARVKDYEQFPFTRHRTVAPASMCQFILLEGMPSLERCSSLHGLSGESIPRQTMTCATAGPPLRSYGQLPKRSAGRLWLYGRYLRPVMHTAERFMVYQWEGSYETRTGAHLRRRPDGHRGVCQYDAQATTGLERWGDWRGRWGGPGGDHGRQPRPGGRHRWGRWGSMKPSRRPGPGMPVRRAARLQVSRRH